MRGDQGARGAKGEAAGRDYVEVVPLAKGNNFRSKGNKRERLDGVKGRKDEDVESVMGEALLGGN